MSANVKDLRWLSRQKCQPCNGTGRIPTLSGINLCQHCTGTGRLPKPWADCVVQNMCDAYGKAIESNNLPEITR